MDGERERIKEDGPRTGVERKEKKMRLGGLDPFYG
jgi:hypothetical protein